jgi:hypothetical protein
MWKTNRLSKQLLLNVCISIYGKQTDCAKTNSCSGNKKEEFLRKMKVAPKCADHSVKYMENKQIEQTGSPKCVDHSVIKNDKCMKNKQIEQTVAPKWVDHSVVKK